MMKVLTIITIIKGVIINVHHSGRTIQLRNSSSVCDSWLSEMGKHRPTSLSLIKAEGEQVTSEGLRELFRQCADSLQVRLQRGFC